MRHTGLKDTYGAESLTSAGNVPDADHQQLEPRSELYDYERLELICKQVASSSGAAEQADRETIQSPTAEHYTYSATSDNLIGIGSGAQAASTALTHSLFRFSLSTDGECRDNSMLGHPPSVENAWIEDFQRQADAVDSAALTRAPATERRTGLGSSRQSVSICKRHLPLGKPFVS